MHTPRKMARIAVLKFFWMFFLPLFALLHVFGYSSFGNSYLKNSRMCRPWNCINTKLGFSDTLPLKEVAEDAFKRNLPQGPWQNEINKVLDNCYGNRTRRYYVNTCPGQALLHCVVDEMIKNCPEESLEKNAECSLVSSLAGQNYMFSQSRYYDLEKTSPAERQQDLFRKRYYVQKCCVLPSIFETATLEDCGFSMFMKYYTHEPMLNGYHGGAFNSPISKVSQNNGYAIKVVPLDQTEKPSLDSTTDPLDCCDIKEFIQPLWRSECDFHLSWKGQERLVIANNTFGLTTQAPVTTSTVSPDASKDVMLVPQSCEKETCLFKSLGVIDEAGTVNSSAYITMLTNFSDIFPNWKKAVGRVVTKCLTRRSRRYDDECEINKILSCTLDVLSENCPYKRKSDDSCRHNKLKRGCQISASKYSPKYRREICSLPQMIHSDYLNQCGLDSIYQVKHVIVTTPKPRKYGWTQSQYLCQDQKPSTTCLMSKMGILNKYKFMDYFRMKDKIREFTANQPVWSALLDIYMSAFINIPMYGEHCSSQKKLLNVVDAMLMTCPVSKRVDTPQCTKFFKGLTDTMPMDNQNVTTQKLDNMIKHYNHIFMSNKPHMNKFNRVIRKKHSKTFRKPLYNYGLLDSKVSPKVTTIDIKPVVITRLDKPLVLAPVYLRRPNLNIATPFHNDGVFRNNPYWLHDRIAEAHITTPHTKTKIDPSYNIATPFHNDGVLRNNPYWLHDRIAETHITTPNTNTIMDPAYTKQSITTPMNPSGPIEPLDSPLRMIKPE